MINSISGIITGKDESSVFIENNGIEWQILMPFNSITKMPKTGEDARVLVYLHHREDVMQLYGFYDKRERSLFFDLLKVGGIGPKQAVRILSGIEVDAFIRQLDENDVDALTRLPGLGKKTAQKIVLTLRGKLSLDDETSSSGSHSDIINALTDMGFDRKKAEAAVRKAADELSASADSSDASDFEKNLFKKAIVMLSS